MGTDKHRGQQRDKNRVREGRKRSKEREKKIEREREERETCPQQNAPLNTSFVTSCSTVGQCRMMACFRGNREEFYGEVLLLDEQKLSLTAEQGVKKSSKASLVLQLVFTRLNLLEGEFFGLRFCDNNQETHWLDPSKSLWQQPHLIGPPYIFYFGVKFYVQDPCKLKQEVTRYQFFLQCRQDVRRGRLPCPAHLRARLTALTLQAEQGDYDVTQWAEPDKDQEVESIYKTLSGVCRPEAECLYLSLCASLQMYGVSLHAAYGENHTKYFLGPTPVGVVIYKNKTLVGKYFWQRISKLHFKEQTFELRVVGKNRSETSFFFHMLERSECKRLWRSCVEHHAFYRMSESNPLTRRLKECSARLPAPQWNVQRPNRITTKPSSQMFSVDSEAIAMRTAPPAVQPAEDGAQEDHGKPAAPWETSGPLSGMFNPKFPPNTEENQGGLQRRSRSLDGDRPIRRQRRRSHSRGNTSSGSESENIAGERRRRRTKTRRSSDALIWKHIQKQPIEQSGLTDRQKEEIPYKEIRVPGEPIGGRQRHRRWASASEIQNKEMIPPLPVKAEFVPPLPVTKATDASCQIPTSP
ncbi:band 4.1-like protein 4 isoform X2 [Genypterus blacodes]|uniref:band 4.1-like protein 4 isoform X2 n=1 Tax=Genypterus blacodes TaxID=154954 RepID=UPI003F766757